jgi:hypothetical protein
MKAARLHRASRVVGRTYVRNVHPRGSDVEHAQNLRRLIPGHPHEGGDSLELGRTDQVLDRFN